MKKLFHSVLSANRKRRNFAVAPALWLLRQARDVEAGEMRRFEGRLDKLDSEAESFSKREYAAIEDEYLDCEHALGVIECAIDDLSLLYCGRFWL